MAGEAWRNFELKPAFNPYSPQERCFFSLKTPSMYPKKGKYLPEKISSGNGHIATSV